MNTRLKRLIWANLGVLLLLPGLGIGAISTAVFFASAMAPPMQPHEIAIFLGSLAAGVLFASALTFAGLKLFLKVVKKLDTIDWSMFFVIQLIVFGLIFGAFF